MEEAKSYSYKKEKMSDQQIKLVISIHKERYLQEKNHVYNRLAKDITIQGFRPGMAPKAMIEVRLGDTLYNELFNHLLPEVTWEILQEEKLNPLSQVKYQITKFSDADGLEYTAVFAEYPQFILGDFKKIKVQKSSVTTSDKEIADEVNNVIKVYSKQDDSKKSAGETAEKDKKTEKDLPQLSDDQVKQLNLGVNTFSELKDLVKKQLLARKDQMEEDKWLAAVIKEAVALSKISVPSVLVNEELARKELDYKKRIEELGLKVEDFLATQKISMEDLKKQWQNEITERLAQELLFVEIAKVNGINVTKEDIDQELDAVTDPKLKEELETNEGKRYIATIKLQQKALLWLREQVAGPVTDTAALLKKSEK